jgi:hypothetical protein
MDNTELNRRTLTPTSGSPCKIGWHITNQGYFTSAKVEKKKPGCLAIRAKSEREED